jgi:hypothetical protein
MCCVAWAWARWAIGVASVCFGWLRISDVLANISNQKKIWYVRLQAIRKLLQNFKQEYRVLLDCVLLDAISS